MRDGNWAREEAQRLFAGEYLCAESVLLSLARAYGVESPLLPRMATGFCSGLARTGGMCGAVSGSVMAFGLFLGRDHRTDDIASIYGLVGEMQEEFQQHFGGLRCPELTGQDLATPEGQAEYQRQGLKDGLCQRLVGWAGQTAFELLAGVGVRAR